MSADTSTVLSLLLFVIILQAVILKYYRLNRISLFIVKLILGMIVMSIVVQAVMFALPSKNRTLGLLELIVNSIIGVVIIILYIVIFDVLGYRGTRHLPSGDKLYQIKRGRRS